MWDKFFDTYTNSDGTSNRKRFLEDIYFAMNKDKIIREAINQGKNAMLKLHHYLIIQVIKV